MIIDLQEKSQELLEILANSIHDRLQKNLTDFAFNGAELHAAKEWIARFAHQINNKCILV